MARCVDLSNPKIFHNGRDKYGNGIYHIPPDLPTDDVVEQKKGRWVPGREIGKEMLTDGTIAVVYEDYKCSSCGLILFRLLHNIDGTPFYKFCPNCGAWMGGDQDDND